jgi:hypothetical protein
VRGAEGWVIRLGWGGEGQVRTELIRGQEYRLSRKQKSGGHTGSELSQD